MGERGPPPTPTAIKILEGNPGQRKLPENEPKPEPVKYDIPPPDHLPDVAKAEWIRLFQPLRLCGLMTVADLSAFAAYCAIYARWIDCEADIAKSSKLLQSATGTVQVNPLIWVARQCLDQMRQYMREFGMTPASRARMGAVVTEAPSKTAPGDDDAAPAAPVVEAGHLTGLIGRQPN